MKRTVLRIKDTFDNKFLKFPVVCKNVNVFNHLCVCFVKNFAGICFCKAYVVYFLPFSQKIQQVEDTNDYYSSDYEAGTSKTTDNNLNYE